MAPGDSVFVVLEPGNFNKYTYKILDDHAGGTFWYHAHHHGSTALQVGGGAAGVLIVEDQEGVCAANKEMHTCLSITTSKPCPLGTSSSCMCTSFQQTLVFYWCLHVTAGCVTFHVADAR